MDAITARSVGTAGIAATVLDWYADHGRDLAFRRTTEPWAILARSGSAGAHVGAAPERGERVERAARGGTPARFASTSRWLRGRIVDRLRDVPDGAWVTFAESIGEHGPAAVQIAIKGLARDGLVEREPGAPETCRIRPASA